MSEELVAQNLKHDVKLFKVKVKTINNAIAAYKKEKTEMSMLQLSALLQMLSLEEVVDANGEVIKKSDFISKKRIILTHMVELVNNQGESVDEDSSVPDSSQESSRQNMRLKPPAIGIIETELATDRSKRSKTVLIPKLSSRVNKNLQEQRSETSSMTES